MGGEGSSKVDSDLFFRAFKITQEIYNLMAKVGIFQDIPCFKHPCLFCYYLKRLWTINPQEISFLELINSSLSNLKVFISIMFI